MERINTYEKWLEAEGLPVIRDYSVSDLMTVPLKQWARKKGSGAYLNLVGAEGTIDAYVCKIPPGETLLPQRHLYEEMIYILSGYGATTVWIDGGDKHTFEWQAGSLFSPPLNSWHQHFNGQSDKPVRYLGMTHAPVSMNLFHDVDFILNNNFVFKKRFEGETGYFSGKGKSLDPDETVTNPKIWDTNFIPDCRTFPLAHDPRRGGISTNVAFELSNNVMSAHIAESLGGTYLTAHFHGPGAHLMCLKGQGYTLLWPVSAGIMAEGVERIKIDWKENGLIAIPGLMFHQHFCTSKEPTRMLAFHAERSRKYIGIGKDYPGGRIKIKDGGRQIGHDEEDPEIRRLFKEEIVKTGAPWRMSEYFPGE